MQQILTKLLGRKNFSFNLLGFIPLGAFKLKWKMIE